VNVDVVVQTSALSLRVHSLRHGPGHVLLGLASNVFDHLPCDLAGLEPNSRSDRAETLQEQVPPSLIFFTSSAVVTQGFYAKINWIICVVDILRLDPLE